jgi:hypothetical protein
MNVDLEVSIYLEIPFRLSIFEASNAFLFFRLKMPDSVISDLVALLIFLKFGSLNLVQRTKCIPGKQLSDSFKL